MVSSPHSDRARRSTYLQPIALILFASLSACHGGEFFGPPDPENSPEQQKAEDESTPNQPQNVGGLGGGSSSAHYLPKPEPLLRRGLHSPPVHICWVSQRGTTDPAAYGEKQVLYESVLEEWLHETNSLAFSFDGFCEGSTQEHGQQIRILLDDRPEARSPRNIEGCSLQEQGRTWAASPEEYDDYASCGWNMSLASNLQRKSSVLHALGHALGLVHPHFGWSGRCPEESPSGYAWNPYFQKQTTLIAMLKGMSEYGLEPGARPLCAAPDGWNDSSPSPEEYLALSLLYPSSLERELVNDALGLPFDGSLVFREGTKVSVTTAWNHSGVTHEWFIDPMWSTKEPLTGFVVEVPGLGLGVTPDPSSIFQPNYPLELQHRFTDPYGRQHDGSTTVEISDSKHTAVISSIL